MKGWKQIKQTKTAEELEAMILGDLSKKDGCPQSGITVTVYGIPWKSMLTFGTAAGPVRNKAELQRFCDIITERLQRLYDRRCLGRVPLASPNNFQLGKSACERASISTGWSRWGYQRRRIETIIGVDQ